jgi:hypothetical protein
MATKSEQRPMTGVRKVFLSLAALLFILLLPGCPFKDNPPNTPAAPTGPTEVSRESSYTYSATTTDPDGDSLYLEFDYHTGDYENSYWSELLPSGGIGSVQVNWWYGGGDNAIRVRALDAHGLYSGWSPELSITVHEPNRTRTDATAQAQSSANLYHIEEEPK